jgi:SlyX protein
VADSSDILKKLIDLESLFAHLQHEFEQLNSVVIEQNQRIDKLESAQQKLEQQVQTLEEDPQNRNPEDERPPHY